MARAIPVILAQMTFPLVALGVVVLAVLAIIIAVVVYNYGNIWFRAYMSSANVSLLSLIGMSFRQVNTRIIVQGEDHGRAGGHRHRTSRPASPPGGWRPTTWPAATCRT